MEKKIHNKIETDSTTNTFPITIFLNNFTAPSLHSDAFSPAGPGKTYNKTYN